jgi:hypothetical protein
VRGRAEREALKGVTCEQCEAFYAACEAWGNCLQRPRCVHDANGEDGKAGAADAAAAAPPPPPPPKQAVNTFQAARKRPPPRDLVQDASRHRFVFEPNPTPPGFWDMGFGDSLDSRVEKRRERERSRANAERRRQLEEDLAAERERERERSKGFSQGGKAGGASGMRQPGI